MFKLINHIILSMRYLIFLITFWLVLTGVGYSIGIFISKMIDKPISKLEEFISKILFINFEKQMDYKEYFIALFGFNLVGLLILFLTLCFQKFLPLNPMHFGNFSWDEALNTAVSFVTNTNWQSYTPESSISYFSQMTGLALQNFLSASTGIAVAFVLFRALKNVENKKLGNFFLDVFRINIYLLLPISFLAAIFLISQGVIQNFSPYIKAHLFDPFVENGKLIKEVLLPMGPVASQEAIKLLGTNGGGFFNANSAHPFENPNYITNAFEAFLIMIIPASLVFSMGNYLKKEKDVFVIYGVMSLLFIGFNLFYVQSFNRKLWHI